MGTPKIAFITGITGQDGAWLTQFLLRKNYEVHGLVRWDAAEGTAHLESFGLLDKVTLYYGDLCDAQNINYLIKKITPDEIYNLGALSHVGVSFETPSSTFDINTKGLLNILDAIRLLEFEHKTRIYQASSSEMFGNAPAPQNEDTPMNPCSPYGVAKTAAFHMARVYRESYGLHVSNGILFNHESSIRGEIFVTRKITRAVAEFAAGKRTEPLLLGNLDTQRDWGHARDYVEGMWLMLQQDEADDYVLATGQPHSVREFVQEAFARIDRQITWEGEGVNEIGRDQNGEIMLRIDPDLYRPNELHYLCGDSTKGRRKFGWAPRTDFKELVAEMVAEDLNGLA